MHASAKKVGKGGGETKGRMYNKHLLPMELQTVLCCPLLPYINVFPHGSISTVTEVEHIGIICG